MLAEDAVTEVRPNLQDSNFRRKAGSAALRAWYKIARKWDLTDREACTLLGTAPSTYRRWKSHPETDLPLDAGTVERLSLLLGIYKDLQILLPRRDVADRWVKKPNRGPLFNGQTPLRRMMGGLTTDLAFVRRHLDAERGGWA